MPETTREAELFTRSGGAFREGTVNDEDRSFEAVLTTETPAAVFDWERYEVIDEVILADGVRFMDYLPLLRSHKRGSELDVIGHHDTPRREGDVWVARAYVAEPAHESDPVREVWQRIKGRHLRAVSIGYWPDSYVDIPAGKTVEVAGREWAAGARGLRVTTQATVFEASVVAIGADSQALIRSRTVPRRGVQTHQGATPRRFRRGFR